MGRLLLVAVAAPALIGSASAAYAPRLVVDPAVSGGGVSISLDQPVAGQSTAAVTILAPPGYRVPLDPPPGAAIGTAMATGIDRTAGSAPFRLAGRIAAAAPDAYTSSECAPGLHRAVWLVTLGGAGRSVTAPVYVDPPRLRLCLGSPDADAGLGITKLELRFAPGVWTAPAAAHGERWRALLTPYAARSADPEPAATVESRAFVRRPQLTLLGKLRGPGRVVLHGRLLAGTEAVARAAVTLFAGRKPVATARTDSAGRYSFARRLGRSTLYRTRVSVLARAVPCRPPSIAPAGCVTATMQPFEVLSTTSVKVTVHG